MSLMCTSATSTPSNLFTVNALYKLLTYSLFYPTLVTTNCLNESQSVGSYRWSIITICLSCTITKIWIMEPQIFWESRP